MFDRSEDHKLKLNQLFFHRFELQHVQSQMEVEEGMAVFVDNVGLMFITSVKISFSRIGFCSRTNNRTYRHNQNKSLPIKKKKKKILDMSSRC